MTASLKAVPTKPLASNLFLTPEDSLSCSCMGYTMTADGKKICMYTDKIDGKTRFVYAAIISDTIVYTIFRKNPDNSVDMLKKWKTYIGIINNKSPYFGVFHWMNGKDKIAKLVFPIIGGHKFYWEENLCKNAGLQKVVTTNNLEMSFCDEAEAKAFFEEVKQIRNRVSTPPLNGQLQTGTGNTNKPLSGKIKLINKTPGVIFIKVEGSGSMQKVPVNSSIDIQCSMYEGRKVFLTSEQQAVLQTLFTVNEDLCKKGEYVIGNR